MGRQFVKAVLFACFSMAAVLLAAGEKPLVIVLATGGTIAGASSSATTNSYDAGKLAIQKILALVPGIDKVADIRYEQVANIPSQDMNDNVIISLAEAAQKYLDDKAVSGIVITHGTDTMEETAFFLNLVLKSSKPVVLTGSMRPSTALSSDVPINVFNAVSVAASPKAGGYGVMIVMNDRIYDARDCVKMNTSTVDTFNAPNSGLIGIIDLGNVKFYKKPVRANTVSSEFTIQDLKSLPDVDIVYEYEGGAPDKLKSELKNKKLKGIVVAGVGDGNLYKDDIPVLNEARKNGIAVVLSSRTGSGCVWKNSELNNDELQFNTADNLNSQKARVLLRMILTKTNDYNKIQEVFDTY